MRKRASRTKNRPAAAITHSETQRRSRVHKLARLRGKSETEADELGALVSGHSLRAGYATSAAARDMPGYRIQQHTRPKSALMIAEYICEADKWTKSGLKGAGF